MVYIRAKKVKGKTYFYVLEGKKENGKTKQTLIKYIGTLSGDTEEVIKKLDLAKEALKKFKK